MEGRETGLRGASGELRAELTFVSVCRWLQEVT